MKYLINFLVAFMIVFIFNLVFVVFNKKKKNKIFSSYGALIIKGRYKCDFEGEDKKKFSLITTFADSFICGFAYMVLRLFDNIYIGFAVATIVLAILIILIYSLIGLLYKKKEGNKDV